MSSLGPIDKVRDTIEAQLQEVLLVLRNQDEKPSTALIDRDFTVINTVHPSLYADLLQPWKPAKAFTERDTVAEGFAYMPLPFSLPVPPVPELTERLINLVAALIVDLKYYLHNTWTASYKSMLDQYVIARSQWIGVAQENEYLRAYAIQTEGDQLKLIDYFGPWLAPQRLEVEEPLQWVEAVPLIRTALDGKAILDVVERYLMTQILKANIKYKPIRELPMPVDVTSFGRDIDNYINDRDTPPEAIAYGGKVAYTYAINLLAQQAEPRGKYYHLLGRDISRRGNLLTVEQRQVTLSVVTAPVDVRYLYDAANRNLPTVLFVTE